jgi:hypothetical protein
MTKPCSTPEKFWSKVDIRDDESCWNWKAGVSHQYGCVGYHRRMHQSHRLAWELTYGPLPEYTGDNSCIVRHLCNNKLCCNPKHLAVGSQTDNMRDMRVIRLHPTAKLLPIIYRRYGFLLQRWMSLTDRSGSSSE